MRRTTSEAWAFILLMLMSFSIFAHNNAESITKTILTSQNPAISLATYYSAEKVAIFESMLVSNGPIDWVECSQNHDSDLFNTIACYVSYKKLPSGMVWEFYYFLEEDKWRGTNLGIIEVIPSEHCVKNIQFKQKLGKGIAYDKVPCN